MDPEVGKWGFGSLRGDFGCPPDAPSALLGPICFANTGEHSFLLPCEKLMRLQQV